MLLAPSRVADVTASVLGLLSDLPRSAAEPLADSLGLHGSVSRHAAGLLPGPTPAHLEPVTYFVDHSHRDLPVLAYVLQLPSEPGRLTRVWPHTWPASGEREGAVPEG